MGYWLYTAIGLSAAQITSVVPFCSLGYWLGYLFLGAFTFVFEPLQLSPALHLGAATTRPLGPLFAAVLIG